MNGFFQGIASGSGSEQRAMRGPPGKRGWIRPLTGKLQSKEFASVWIFFGLGASHNSEHTVIRWKSPWRPGHESNKSSQEAEPETRMVRLALLAAIAGMATAFSPSGPMMSLQSGGAPRVNLRAGAQIWTPPSMMPEQPKPDGPPKPSIPMPMVSVGEGQMDIYSRLAKDRILLLGTDVNDEVCVA